MTDNDSPTRFNLELPGLRINISGEKAFVEELYYALSHDLLPLFLAGQGATPTPTPQPTPNETSDKDTYSWVYRCSEFFNKVYAVNDQQLRAGILGSCVDPRRIRRVYVARDDRDLFTSLAGTHKSLWAEFTQEGVDRFQG
jgi:hypothetical protein